MAITKPSENWEPRVLSEQERQNNDIIIAQRRAQDRADEEKRQLGEIKAAAKRLWLKRGSRYEACTLGNFRIATAEQGEVMTQLRRYWDGLAGFVHAGVGLILTGPPGTGKDHLMAAMMHGAIADGFCIKWASGVSLSEQWRDGIDGEWSESTITKEYAKADIFALSDPTWERIPLSNFQRQKLSAIVDARYNNCRPTWATINANDRQEAEKLLGRALLERLTDGALSLACNWGTYRKSRQTLAR